MRKILAGGFAAGLLALFPAGSIASGPDKPSAAEEPPKPIKADTDGDKLFDDLEARLASAGAADRIEVIVRLDPPATIERIARLERIVGNFAVSHRFFLLNGFAATLTKAQVKALVRLPGIVHIEENSRVRAFNDTTQSSFGVTNARIDAGVDGDGDGNSTSYSQTDLVAAVIDTGIDTGHKDLDGGKVLAFVNCVGGCATTKAPSTPLDDNGHGTHVAATIAGDGEGRPDRLYKGVSDAAALVGVKVLNAQGSGSMADVTAGIQWVVANKDAYGIEAINLSLGTSGCSNGTDTTSAAVNAAHDAGIVVAVAAGNSGPGTCTIGSPGAAAKALTVGAMADMGATGFHQAYFSSRGKTADGRMKPDVSGPGVDVTSADNGTATGYITYSGTSMATPFVAGVALLMRDANPGLTSQQVKETIMATAVDWGPTGIDIDYGAGRLDAYAAIGTANGSSIGPSPPMPVHELKEGSLSGTGETVDYRINVTDTQFPIAATLIHSSVSGGTTWSPDFDLFLYAPSGAELDRGYTSRRQEEVSYKPTVTGAYTIRVKSYIGSGPYVLDISAGTSPPPPDTTAPTVTSVSPAEGATGIAPGTNVSVTFDEPMDTAATQAASSLVRTSDSAAVSGTFSWSGNTMTFDPSADLAASTQYTAKVTTAAKDTAGNPLATEKVWSFTTAAAPPPPSIVTAYPGSTTIQSGSLRSGDATRLAADDNSFYEVNSTTSITYTSSFYGTINDVSNGLTSLKVSYSGKNSRTCSQTVSLWRWTDSTWVQLDSRSVGTTEILIADRTPSGTLANYVSGSSGDGDVRVRIRCTTYNGTFFASADLLKIVFARP